MIAGIGENGHDDGNWILNSVASRVHGPGHDGIATVTFHDFNGDPVFAKLGPDHAGPNLLRVRKLGDTLTFAICADYKGKFEPDFSSTVPSLSTQAHDLTVRNTSLFVYGGGTIEKMRLVVDGQPAGGPWPRRCRAARRPRGRGRPGPRGRRPVAPGPGGWCRWRGRRGCRHGCGGRPRRRPTPTGCSAASCAASTATSSTRTSSWTYCSSSTTTRRTCRVGVGEDKGQWGEAPRSPSRGRGGLPSRATAPSPSTTATPRSTRGKSVPAPGRTCCASPKRAKALALRSARTTSRATPSTPPWPGACPTCGRRPPFLTGRNGNLFVAGNSTWCAAGLSVNGKAAGAGPPPHRAGPPGTVPRAAGTGGTTGGAAAGAAPTAARRPLTLARSAWRAAGLPS